MEATTGLQGYINGMVEATHVDGGYNGSAGLHQRVVEATHVRSEATTGLQGFTNAPLPTLIKGTKTVGVLVARSAGTTFTY